MWVSLSHTGRPRFWHTKFKILHFSVANRHAMTKHQYYLQMRKDVLEERMRCDTENAMLLASLALQAEFSDYQPEVQTRNTFTHLFLF